MYHLADSASSASADPKAATISADWSIGFYAGTPCGQTPWPSFGATMSGTGSLPEPHTNNIWRRSISKGNPNLRINLYADYGYPNSPWKYRGSISGWENGFGLNLDGPGPSFSPYSIAVWQVTETVVYCLVSRGIRCHLVSTTPVSLMES